MTGVHILTVCTANICRSPATAALLRRGLEGGGLDLEIHSAGVAAVGDMPACERSSALVGDYMAATYATDSQPDGFSEHRSRRVLREDLADADLVLALDRTHRSALAQVDPSSRPRTFTLRQAAAAAQAVAEELRLGTMPEGAPPIPAEPAERFRWWVAELDAIRGFVSSGGSPESVPEPIDPLDVPDPHVVGHHYHPMALELIESAVLAIVDSLNATAAFDGDAGKS